jgi:hypothetical protein
MFTSAVTRTAVWVMTPDSTRRHRRTVDRDTREFVIDASRTLSTRPPTFVIEFDATDSNGGGPLDAAITGGLNRVVALTGFFEDC